MNARTHHFTAAPLEDGYVHLCTGCDKPRSGPLAYCDSCEAVTESYAFRDDGSVSGSDLLSLEAAVLSDCDRLYELRNGSLGFTPTIPYGMGRLA